LDQGSPTKTGIKQRKGGTGTSSSRVSPRRG
jgi:hypothetical protein